MHRVRIGPRDNMVPALGEILHALPAELKSSLDWRIVDIYGVGTTHLGGLPAVELLAAEGRLILSWESLVRFSAEIFDTFDALIVGDREPEVTEVKLQLFDSSYWVCSFAEEAVAKAFAERFSGLSSLEGRAE